jgi:hypothetical protein
MNDDVRRWRLRSLQTAGKQHGAILLFLAGLVIFGSHLQDGYLSDDFLFVLWAKRSLATLLAKLTVKSYPQVIRPLPALAWMLSRCASGSLLLHGLSLMVHAANSVLVLILSKRWKAPDLMALILGALFLVFPLAGEAVLWLSCGFDLWATFFSLLAILTLQSSEAARKISWIGVTFYALALLCKESAFALPLALPFLFPTIRRRTLPFFGLMAIYLTVRLMLFRGLGGYKDKLGQPVVLQGNLLANIQTFARALLAQIPLRILAPMPVESHVAIGLMAGMSLVLLATIAWSSERLLRSAILAASVFVIALLPAAHLVRIEWDLQGSRLIYLPFALALTALARSLRPTGKLAGASGVILASCWLVAAILNGKSWTRAGAEARNTIKAMERFQPGLPSGSTVLVDTLDTFRGAYVFRNGLSEAAELDGLRRDLGWKRGTAALLGAGAESELGSRLFEIGFDDQGHATDWTRCERSLGEAVPRGDALPFVPSPEVPPSQPARRWLAETTTAESTCQRLMLSMSCPDGGSRTGTLFWKNEEREPFTTMKAREFKLSSAPLPVRISGLAPRAKLWLRIDLDQPMASDCWRPLMLAPCPSSCADVSQAAARAARGRSLFREDSSQGQQDSRQSGRFDPAQFLHQPRDVHGADLIQDESWKGKAKYRPHCAVVLSGS